jgi:hypothetical protein
LTHHGIRDVAEDNPKRDGETAKDYEARITPIMHESWRCTEPVIVNRIALNMDQVEQYTPPPNPAKMSDSRATGYVDKFGGESWELDALEPAVITRLIQEAVFELLDRDTWEESQRVEDEHKQDLKVVAGEWDVAVDATKRVE